MLDIALSILSKVSEIMLAIYEFVVPLNGNTKGAKKDEMTNKKGQ